MLSKSGILKDGLQILERVEVSVDSDDEDFAYEEVALNDAQEDEDENELEEALASIQARQRSASPLGVPQPDTATSLTQVRPSVVDDFVRNFLIKAGMKKTLDAFNTEWYELKTNGRLPAELSVAVPDIYLRNEDLDVQTRSLREQVEKMREVANKAQTTWDKFRKERDFHRMHHKRVSQEKNKLLGDIKRLRAHSRSFEPMIEELKRKHESAMKEKMLVSLERDRLRLKLKAIGEAGPQSASNEAPVSPAKPVRSATRAVRRQAVMGPDDPSANPFSEVAFDPAPLHKLVERKSHRAHVSSVSAVAFHPKKPVVATASDDETWRLWTMPDCELVMSGEGHHAWLSSVQFHPLGSHLATASGDSSIKLWELAQAKCTATFTDHTLAVWGVDFHHSGDLVASCSMDCTVRVWDLLAGKCRQTLRGHADSVNAVAWVPYTSSVCSGGGDKTVSVWDARSGLCVQTLYGHANAVNSVCVSGRGDTVVSCDADGAVRVWDTRKVQQLGCVEVSDSPLNCVALDRGALRCLAAADDGSIKVISLADMSVLHEFAGHDDAVQCVALAPNDSCFVSGGSDSALKIWGNR